MTSCDKPECPWCHGPGDYESRYTWEYIDNVREFARRHGTLEQPQVVRLLELLEIGTRHRHGERK